jgi:YidC/Oxa1 family membrane protein insertase
MDKRVLLTVAISMAILFAWTKFFAPPPPPKTAQAPTAQAPAPPPAAPTVQPSAPPAPGEPAAATGRKPGEPALAAPAAPVGAPSQPSLVRPPEQRAAHEEPGLYKAELSSWGAALAQWTLLKPQYQETIVEPNGNKELGPINLVRTKGAQLPLVITFPQSDFTLAPDAAWTRVEDGRPDQVAYTWESADVRVEKRFTFVPKTYQLQLTVTVENKRDKPLAEHLQLAMFGYQDPSVKPGGMFSRRYAQTEGQCHVNGKLKHADLQSLLKANLDEVGSVRWIGTDEKYFLAAIAQPPIANEQQRCWVSASVDGIISTNLLEGERQVPAKGKTEYVFAGFVGPKILSQLDDIMVGGQDAKLGDSVNYGWTEAIARPMLAVLKAIHSVVPNWGVAIILLTILLKAVTWWPTSKSMKSMREMAKLKPEIDKLKERCGDDKQKFNVETMKLYKERGINPLGGCLPMLIQMPIYIALYSMLGNSVELYRSSFLFWIHDLTAPDPYYVLPAVTGVLMFVQQKISPQTSTDPQQKMMMYMMPVMFTVFTFVLPAGLTIYILTNTLLTFVQQFWLNRGQGPVVGRPAVKPAKA